MANRLNQLRRKAETLGVKIEAERDDYGWGYWLVNAKTGGGVIAGDDFCESHEEIEYKLELYAAESSAA